MEQIVPAVSALIALLGAAIAALPLSKLLAVAGFIPALIPALKTLPPGPRLLLVFAIICAAFGAIVLVYYWPEVIKNVDLMILVVGLFLTMVFGMFVQVLAANYRAGTPLLSVTASQLIFPMLFSIVVFYPIWAVAASAPRGFFSVYTAFLNGYFWEHVVSAAKPPTAAGRA